MDMGPLVSEPHLEKVCGYVDLGVEEGTGLVVDGRSLTVPEHEEGYFTPISSSPTTARQRRRGRHCWGTTLFHRDACLRVPGSPDAGVCAYRGTCQWAPLIPNSLHSQVHSDHGRRVGVWRQGTARRTDAHPTGPT